MASLYLGGASGRPSSVPNARQSNMETLNSIRDLLRRGNVAEANRRLGVLEKKGVVPELKTMLVDIKKAVEKLQKDPDRAKELAKTDEPKHAKRELASRLVSSVTPIPVQVSGVHIELHDLIKQADQLLDRIGADALTYQQRDAITELCQKIEVNAAPDDHVSAQALVRLGNAVGYWQKITTPGDRPQGASRTPDRPGHAVLTRIENAMKEELAKAGIKTGRVIDSKGESHEVTIYDSMAKLLGSPLADLIPPGRRQTFENLLKQQSNFDEDAKGKESFDAFDNL